MKKIGDMTVNDGKGLMDNEGMCDSLGADLNMLVKAMAAGQYVAFCGKVHEMAVKLTNLKKGIKADLESKDKIIEELKQINDSLVEQITGLPVEKKDGAKNGVD